MTFVRRKISLAVQLGTATKTNQPNTFVETGTDTVSIENARISVQIQNSGAPVDCYAQVKAFGLAPSLMNQLSTLGLVYNIVPQNKITITAGDAGGSMSTVFSGTIFSAYGDYSAQPNIPFQFDCLSLAYDAVAPRPVSSYTGTTSVVTIMQGLARQMNLGFENNGVDVQLSSPYYSGSPRQQADQCARDAGIKWAVINGNMLAIWPNGKYRSTPNVPTISPATGLISSPAFTQQGVIIRTLFNPNISFGGLIRLESAVLQGVIDAQTQKNQQFKAPQNSQWAVNKLDHILEAETPGGQWMSIVHAYNPNYPKPIPQPAQG